MFTCRSRTIHFLCVILLAYLIGTYKIVSRTCLVIRSQKLYRIFCANQLLSKSVFTYFLQKLFPDYLLCRIIIWHKFSFNTVRRQIFLAFSLFYIQPSHLPLQIIFKILIHFRMFVSILHQLAQSQLFFFHNLLSSRQVFYLHLEVLKDGIQLYVQRYVYRNDDLSFSFQYGQLAWEIQHLLLLENLLCLLQDVVHVNLLSFCLEFHVIQQFLINLQMRQRRILLPTHNYLPTRFFCQFFKFSIKMERCSLGWCLSFSRNNCLPEKGKEIALGFVTPNGHPQKTSFSSHGVKISHHFVGIFSQHQNQIGDNSVKFMRRFNRFLPIGSFQSDILLQHPILNRTLNSYFPNMLLNSLPADLHHRLGQISCKVSCLLLLESGSQRDESACSTSNFKDVLRFVKFKHVDKCVVESIGKAVNFRVFIRKLIPEC